MGDVGDVDAHLVESPPPRPPEGGSRSFCRRQSYILLPLGGGREGGFEGCYAERIVEVLGVTGVDGEGEHVAEVLAALEVGCRDVGIDLASGLLHLLRILIGQAVLGQDGVHLDVVVALLAQHVDDLADEVLRLGRRPLRDAHDGLLAGLAALQLLLRDEDVLSQLRAVGVEEGIVLLDLEDADGLLVLALDDLGDDGLAHVVGTARHHRHADAVAAHGHHRVALGDKDGLAATVGDERVLAVGLADEGALLHLRLQVQAVGAVLRLHHIVVPRHLVEGVDGEHLQRMRVESESLEYLAQRHCFAGVSLKEALQRVGHVALRASALHRLVFSHSYCRILVVYVAKIVFFSEPANLFLLFIDSHATV